MVRHAALLIASLAVLGACSGRAALPPPGAGGFDSAPGALAADPASPAFFRDAVGDRVLFSVDQSTLDDAARATLAAQAGWLAANPGYTAVIEGHADEQGTREYNLALGARRANAAQEYLVSQGVAPGRLRTVSLRQGAPHRDLLRGGVLRAQPTRGHGPGPRRGGLRMRGALILAAALAGPWGLCAQEAAIEPPAGEPALAGAPTLADIRQELAVLEGELQRLQRELSTTGGAGVTLPESALARIDAIEAALRDLTARTEALTGRIDRVVADGTNRLGDLRFRLAELAGEDPGALPPTAPLGGEAPAAPAQPTPPEGGGAELAMAEQADFDRATAASEAGDHAEAARLFGAFADAYPGSPLAGEAQLLRGRALEEQGDLAGAARAFLAGFSGDPNGDRAGETLLALGGALRDLGQTQEACVTFAEVRVRFQESEAAQQAKEASAALSCP